ncbi:uncharacterized protein LOC129590253 isoform X2 [Paramacrobiotus metropolitanus]|uniref:uncharacterized protein LOC129590253 isoform X2 n=1 Tax=Paramacrobiotus metropolitanus TaxID=2943436 RepID=UPI002445D55F|nr:uncharacterized protein LOC129590253 isoform X2 [Paramacrobiotus metropolitanus]
MMSRKCWRTAKYVCIVYNFIFIWMLWGPDLSSATGTDTSFNYEFSPNYQSSLQPDDTLYRAERSGLNMYVYANGNGPIYTSPGTLTSYSAAVPAPPAKPKYSTATTPRPTYTVPSPSYSPGIYAGGGASYRPSPYTVPYAPYSPYQSATSPVSYRYSSLPSLPYNYAASPPNYLYGYVPPSSYGSYTPYAPKSPAYAPKAPTYTPALPGSFEYDSQPASAYTPSKYYAQPPSYSAETPTPAYTAPAYTAPTYTAPAPPAYSSAGYSYQPTAPSPPTYSAPPVYAAPTPPSYAAPVYKPYGYTPGAPSPPAYGYQPPSYSAPAPPAYASPPAYQGSYANMASGPGSASGGACACPACASPCPAEGFAGSIAYTWSTDCSKASKPLYCSFGECQLLAANTYAIYPPDAVTIPLCALAKKGYEVLTFDGCYKDPTAAKDFTDSANQFTIECWPPIQTSASAPCLTINTATTFAVETTGNVGCDAYKLCNQQHKCSIKYADKVSGDAKAISTPINVTISTDCTGCQNCPETTAVCLAS